MAEMCDERCTNQSRQSYRKREHLPVSALAELFRDDLGFEVESVLLLPLGHYQKALCAARNDFLNLRELIGRGGGTLPEAGFKEMALLHRYLRTSSLRSRPK